MKTYNELERMKKDKIKNLSVDEIIAYVDKLNIGMAEAWGSLDNSYRMDPEVMIKNAELCDEAVDLLSDKYRMDVLVSNSRLNALVDKHQKDIADIKNLFLEIRLDKLMTVYYHTYKDLFILELFLDVLYQDYWTPPANIEEMIDKTDVAEEHIHPVALDLNEIPPYELYNHTLMDNISCSISIVMKFLNRSVEELRDLTNFKFIDPEVMTGTYYDTFREGMLQYQEDSKKLLERYDMLMTDGFHYCKLEEADIIAGVLDKDRDEIMDDIFTVGRPYYDLKNNVFIPPQRHIEAMDKLNDA